MRISKRIVKTTKRTSKSMLHMLQKKAWTTKKPLIRSWSIKVIPQICVRKKKK